jgi:cell shape-determining protein MreC
MTTFRQVLERSWPPKPGLQCAIACAVGLALTVVPPRYFTPLRNLVESALAPGQRTVAAPLDAGHDLADRLAQLWNASGALTRLETRIRELEVENQELAWKLQASAAAAPESTTEWTATPTQPLGQIDLVEARVLGRRARSYLAHADLLDIGSESGVSPQSLVLDPRAREPALLDVGSDGGLSPSQRVLSGFGGAHLVWGQLVEVGKQTSTLRRASDSGYRDLVELAHSGNDGLRIVARGMLEGVGDRHCRITRVELAAPVEVGDLVFAADTAGLRPNSADVAGRQPPRFLYGAVVRVQRPLAGTHWEIWMAPAAPPDYEPWRVAVIATRLNPDRIAHLRQSPAAAAGGVR